jgi:hypothetical protein
MRKNWWRGQMSKTALFDGISTWLLERALLEAI